ncbi:MAG: hypothetical protein A2Y69_10595 [Candidatus Aminicenantes bacterium RBG_13_59_9]|jgi:hypothetical protein|nr:MAG: hypothetical protein A2Y69_10595 [Candidatus Aminicenantes bacterium RBG_13_59_9]
MSKTSTTVLFIAMLFAVLYSLAIIVSPQTFANSTLEARAETKLENIQDQGAAETLVVQTRHMGVFALTTSIAMFFILLTGFKKGQKWAWWAFLFVGGIAWIYGLSLQISEGDMMNLIGHVIGVGLWLIGILLPIKSFFPKKA